VKYQVCSPDVLSKLLVKFGVTQPAAETSWFKLICISFQ
jgi:20S proteasome subunit alpha 3